MSNYLRPHGLQHSRPPCLSPTPRVYSTHIHWVGDAIQPSHPLSSPSLSTFNLSQHQGIFQWVSFFRQVAKVLEFQHQSFQWIFRVDFLWGGLVWSPCCPLFVALPFGLMVIHLCGCSDHLYVILDTFPSLIPHIQSSRRFCWLSMADSINFHPIIQFLSWCAPPCRIKYPHFVEFRHSHMTCFNWINVDRTDGYDIQRLL